MFKLDRCRLPESTVHTVREFVFAGYFSLRTLIVIGVILFLLVCALTWRECRASRPRLAPILILLRAGALAMVLWMLAGPTVLTKVRTTHPRSVAVVADVSGSMDVADDANEETIESGTLRWAVSPEEREPLPLVSHLDAAAVKLLLGRNLLAAFSQNASRISAREQSQRSLARAQQLIQETAADLDELSRPASSTQLNAQQEIEGIRTTLSADVLPQLKELSLDSGQTSLLSDPTRADRLNELAAALDGLSAKLSETSDRAAVSAWRDLEPALRDRLRARLGRRRSQLIADRLRGPQSAWLERLGSGARLMRYCFDGSIVPVGGWVDGLAAGTPMTTNVAGALEQVARDSAAQPIEAVILLTDGGHNTDGDPLKSAAAMSGLPVYVVPIGQTKPLRDIMLHHVQAPRAVFKNDSIVIDGTVDAYGSAGEELTIDLLGNDHVLDTQRVAASSDAFVHAFTFRRKAEEVGMQKLRVHVHPLPDERVQDNNDARLDVEVTEDKIRVLLADHLPRWEHRYLRNLFKRDERVQLDELLFEPARSDGGPAVGSGFPNDLESWSRYRVVILGDIGPDRLIHAQQKMLVQFVSERGGTLILIAGDEAMPAAYARQSLTDQALGPLLPVDSFNSSADDSQFNLYVTAEGAELPVTQLMDDPAASQRLWREQLPIHHLSAYSKAKPTSHVWVAASTETGAASPQQAEAEHAFLCWQPYGSGRVVYLSAPVTYRLRYRYGDRYHHRFWGQLLRWAMARDLASGSKTIRLSTDKTRYKHGETVDVTVRLTRLNGEAVSGLADCRVIARQDGRIVASTNLPENVKRPGEYRTTIKRLPNGSVTLTVVSEPSLLASEGRTEPVETVVVVEPEDELEMRNTRCNLPLLMQIAKATGGMVVPPTALATLASHLDLEPTVTEQVSQQPVWARWAYLWIFIGCLTAEWVVRKFAGMA